MARNSMGRPSRSNLQKATTATGAASVTGDEAGLAETGVASVETEELRVIAPDPRAVLTAEKTVTSLENAPNVVVV